MTGAIIYKGKYGATAQYATWLGSQLQVPVIEADSANADVIAKFDYLLLGASVYIGTTKHKEWLKQHADLLKTKKLFHFIVCATPPEAKEKLQPIINNNIPVSLLQPASLWFLPGRMIKKDLSWKDRFILKMGAMLEKNPASSKKMLTDFDNVKVEHISPLVKAVLIFLRQERNDSKKLEEITA